MHARLLVLLALGITSPLAAQPEASDEKTIVVTGKPLSELQRDLAACLARDCPPAEDMRLTLAVAEAQFVGGRYRDARAALRASLQRHPGAAKAHAPLVAALHRAGGRISLHYGDREAALQSTFGIARAMQAGFGDDSPQLFFARLEAVDMMVRTQVEGDRIVHAFDDLARQAGRMGDPRYASVVELRRAWLEALRQQYGAAEARLSRVAESGSPSMALAADVVRMRIAAKRGDGAQARTLLASIVRHGASQARPQLISKPNVDLGQAPRRMKVAKFMQPDSLEEADSETDYMGVVSPESTWVDVGFWIAPDGSVREAEVLRPDERRWWHARVLDAVGRRQYSSYAAPTAEPTVYRVERFTLNSRIERATGTRLARRESRYEIENLDLSVDESAPAAR